MSFGGFIRRSIYWTNDCIHGKKVRKHYNEIGTVLSDYEKGHIIRDKNLDLLLKHSVKYSEFYKSFAGRKLKEFPVVNKSILIQNHDAVTVDIKNIPEQETETVHVQRTSGSTGTPFAVFQDSRKRYRRIAELKYFGNDIGFKSHEKLGQCRIWTKWHSKSKWQSFRENIFPINIGKVDDNSLKEICEQIRKNKIVSLRAYASWYERLAEFLEQHQEYISDLKSIKTAILISEALNEVTREKIKNLIGVSIVECYADEEAGIMAQQKPDDTNYYLNHAGYVFEILKLDSDEPAEYGKLGRIVITDLYNYAFPLIRYDTGDTAILAKGNNTSHGWDYLSRLYGRRLDLIYDVNGNALHPMNFARVLKNISGIVQWQFIQKDETVYVLKLNADKELNMNSLMSEIKEIVGKDADITVEMVNDIPVLASGKRKPVVCEWKKN